MEEENTLKTNNTTTSENTTSNEGSGLVKLTNNFKIESELFEYIPQESAELYKILPLKLENNNLIVGIAGDKIIDARKALNFISAKHKITYSLQEIDEEKFNKYFEQYGQISSAMTEAIASLEDLGDDDENVILGIEDGAEDQQQVLQDDAPIIKLVSTILAQAVQKMHLMYILKVQKLLVLLDTELIVF